MSRYDSSEILRYEPCDSYEKNSYIKNTVCRGSHPSNFSIFCFAIFMKTSRDRYVYYQNECCFLIHSHHKISPLMKRGKYANHVVSVISFVILFVLFAPKIQLQRRLCDTVRVIIFHNIATALSKTVLLFFGL